MKLNSVVIVVLFECLGAVMCHMPTVYEFCSHVVANEDPERAGAHCASQCQGRPGKIGPAGPRGITGSKGQKGDKGEQRNVSDLEARVQKLEASQQGMLEYLLKTPEFVEGTCYMGMKNGDIPDSALTSSSNWNSDYVPTRVRLDTIASGSLAGCWTAGKNRVGEWIQIDLGEPKPLAGIVTQGREDETWGIQFVSSFKVTCGNNVSNFETISENGADKIFAGNSDKNTKVVNMFPTVLTCRFVRVYPQTWQRHLSMRLELLHGKCYGYWP